MRGVMDFMQGNEALVATRNRHVVIEQLRADLTHDAGPSSTLICMVSVN